MLREDFKEKTALALIFYWLTILVARSISFYYEKKNLPHSFMIIRGLHLYHFVFVLFCVAILASVLSLFGFRRHFFLLVFFGISLGLLFDEINFLFNAQFANYWALSNFFAIIIIGLPLGLILFWPRKKEVILPPAPLKIFPHLQGKPFLSVVIPALNEEKFLSSSLASLLRQTYRNFEVIVVDNNSNDRTRGIAKSFGARIIVERRRGVSYARQAGFQAARGEVIATTDADTILPPFWLARIANEFKRDQNMVAFGGLYQLYSGSMLARIYFSYFFCPLWILDHWFFRGWGLLGSNLAVAKKAFRQVGGFPEGIAVGEDIYLARRLQTIGRVGFDPHFQVLTSGRRYKDGLLRAFWTYFPTRLSISLAQTKKFNRLAAVRSEKPSLAKIAFSPLFFAILFLFFLFYFSNPTISEAKGVKFIKHKIRAPLADAKKDTKEVKSFFVKAENKIKIQKKGEKGKIWKSSKPLLRPFF